MRSLIFPLIPLIVEAASVATSTSLNIPIKDILSRNFKAYLEHPLMPTFQNWLKENQDLDFISGNATVPVTLNAIHCDYTGCLFESSTTLDADTVKALEHYGKQENKKTLLPRVNAINWISATHWKTYWSGQEGGAEHYTTWDLLCHRLTYRGTGWVLDDHSIEVKGDNDIFTRVKAWEFRHPEHRVSLKQNFSCSFFGGKCCVNHNDVYATSGMKRWTWDCSSGRRADPCQG